MAEIEPQLAAGSAGLRAEVEALKRDLARARERWLTDGVTKQLLGGLQSAIRAKVANAKSSVYKTLVWAKTKLERETVAKLAKQLQPLDDVSVADKPLQVRLGIDHRVDLGRFPTTGEDLGQLRGIAVVTRVGPNHGEAFVDGHPIDRRPRDVDSQLHTIPHLDVLRGCYPLLEAGLGITLVAAKL